MAKRRSVTKKKAARKKKGDAEQGPSPAIFNRILEALAAGNDDLSLDFGYYKIDKELGHGQQGIVVRVLGPIGKRLALKFYRPTDTDPALLDRGLQRFVNEVNILASLDHKNIVRIHAGGIATWSDNNGWYVREGFDDAPHSSTLLAFYYYLMDYIPGSSLEELFPALVVRDGTPDDLFGKSDEQNQSSLQGGRADHLRLFEELVSQISTAIEYYQSKEITHKDIKPANIRYRKEDDTFIVVDFGFARHVSSPQDEQTVPRTEYMDYPSIQAKDYYRNDMGSFARIVDRILQSLQDEYDHMRFTALKTAVERGYADLDRRFRDMGEFYGAVSPYFVGTQRPFTLALNEYLLPDRFGRFDSKLRIPVSGSILLTKDVKRIIDTADFQRLRGVRQLGPTIFVFPGANHTRFEHSLGAYSLALRYLERLLMLPGFAQACYPREESVKYCVLAALLHDIGHYPYSHWIEEIKTFPGGWKLPAHEERARSIICRDPLASMIRDDWGVEPDVLADIISTKGVTGANLVVNSFINSIVDVDKLDYLIRDSIHCGVDYGRGIDIERLLESLWLGPEDRQLHVTEKGRSCLLSILTCRNIMYKEVYWHKTVRGCDAMFKRFFFEFVRQGLAPQERIQEYLGYSDDEFIATLFRDSKSDPQLNRLIAPFALRHGRSLYKPVFTFVASQAQDESVDVQKFFGRLFQLDYARSVAMSEKLAKALQSSIPGIEPLDIILEAAPIRDEHEYSNIGGLKIWNSRKERYEKPPTQVDALNRFLSDTRESYLFCAPKFCDALYDLIRRGSLAPILAEVTAE